jgi:DNA-binding beta-propeller fold protein YncE
LQFSTALRAEETTRRWLYVATPGVRNYLDYGGHGLLVFDIDRGHRFVKRIPLAGIKPDGTPINVKGICAHAETARVYVSTIDTLMCLSLTSERLLWERRYEKGCDRMALSPDGRTMYLPTFESDFWHVLDALSGDVIARVEPKSKSHNTIYGPDGARCYLAGLGSPLLTVAETSKQTIAGTVGPFSHSIRPFTINGVQTRVYCCVNECLGFEAGDLRTGEKLCRVEVEGFEKGPVKRHGCPSHGIGLTPDETEIWLCDAHNQRLHVFDATTLPPRQIASLPCRDEPGWISFSIDGTLAYPSSGEVYDVKTRKVVAELTDETGRAVGSEKLLEIDWQGNRPVRAGNQFGIGGKR